ncbi:hypothetical protein OAT18_00325 [Tenacibaculum sp.]|nr:hypothetical protein [Tenacibaculum sp.]
MKNSILIAVGIFVSQLFFGQECLNVKFKLRGYFYVGTSQVDSTAAGGFYADNNSPKQLTSKISKYSKSNKLEIIVKTDLIADFEKGISGFKIFVINKSDSVSELPAQDSRLYLKRQVYYKNKWKDIEYLPSSWCGNSYHNVYIKPNEYWDFTGPCLKGEIKAKFRFELYINEDLKIYSNEFEGSFNKRQLKKEQGNKPISIMDPYNN